MTDEFNTDIYYDDDDATDRISKTRQ